MTAPGVENLTRGSRRAYRAGIQGTLAIYSHFIYITNTLPPSPQPQPVPLQGKPTDALPLGSHSSPNPSPTHQPVPHNPNTRTCPQGHLLVFPLPSLVSNTRTRPQGCVLVFGHYFLPPRHKNATWGRVLCIWNVADTLPAPSTAQTRGTRPYGHVLCVWGISLSRLL